MSMTTGLAISESHLRHLPATSRGPVRRRSPEPSSRHCRTSREIAFPAVNLADGRSFRRSCQPRSVHGSLYCDVIVRRPAGVCDRAGRAGRKQVP